MSANFVYRPDCDLCGSDNITVLISQDFTTPLVWNFLERYYEGRINKGDLKDGNYEITRCQNCGFIWQSYILNDKLMERLYNDWISSEQSLNKKRYGDISLFSGYARQTAMIAHLLWKKPFEIDVLDFGMGWGYWCLMAKAFGYNIYGFEISTERINFARDMGIYVINDFGEIMNHRFDFINSVQVFEHIPNPLQTLKTLARALKEGGIIRISVPNGKNIEKELSNPEWKVTKNAIQPLEHINCFTHDTLVKLGRSAGLELISTPLLTGCKRNFRRCVKRFVKGVFAGAYKPRVGTSLIFKKHSSKLI